MSKRKPTLAGHMKKAIDRLESLAGAVNLVIEAVDARAPEATNCNVASTALRGMTKIIALTKADLANPAATALWLDHYKKIGQPAMVFPYGQPNRRNEFLAAIAKMSGAASGEDAIRAVVVGIPNIGKSTLLNYITGKKSAPVGAMPGITRGVQIIKVSDNFLVLDTPGIVSSAAGEKEGGMMLAAMGCLQESAYESDEAAFFLVRSAFPEYAKMFAKFYDLKQVPADAETFFEALAKRRGYLLKGGALDLDKTYPVVMRDFSTGRLSGITLQKP